MTRAYHFQVAHFLKGSRHLSRFERGIIWAINQTEARAKVREKFPKARIDHVKRADE